MRCLQIITRIANGGAEEVVFDLIVELAKHGIDSDLMIGQEAGQDNSSLDVLHRWALPKSCNVYTIPHLVRNPKPLYEVRALKEIRTRIREHQYTIVHTHGSKAGILGRIAAHREKVPVIIATIHGISFPSKMKLPFQMLFKSLERYTAKFSDALICVGEDMRNKYLAAKVGVPEQYWVINGMRLNQFTEKAYATQEQRRRARVAYGLPENLHTIVLGSIGRLENRKNQKALVAMLPKLIEKTPDIHLCLVGDGPNLDTLQGLAQSYGVADKITFLGYVSDVWNMLPALDIHCMVSLWEGLSRTMVQTAAAGLPNICYEVDGAWEVIFHNESGYIIERDNEDQYISHLVTLITEKKLRAQFGKKAVECTDKKWSLDTFGKDVAHLYTTLLDSKNRK